MLEQDNNTTTDKKDYKSRTSITIEPSLFESAKQFAKDNGKSFSSVVEDALRAKLGG